ncbi:hypothetical protein ACFL08_05990 [Patescibacteria group bacterium]
MMCKVLFSLLCCYFFIGSASAQDWTLDTNSPAFIRSEEFNEQLNCNEGQCKPVIFGRLVDAPSENGCYPNELLIFHNKMLEFDISIFSRLAGDSFDVNYIYVDGIVDGEIALGAWLGSFYDNDGVYGVIPLYGGDLSSSDYEGKFKACIGKKPLTIIGDNNKSFENIVLWYGGPVITTEYVKDDGVKEDVSTVPGSLAVSNADQTLEGVGSAGYDSDPDPEETADDGKPNFVVNEVKLKDLSGEEKYIWNKIEEMYIHAWFENKGDTDWDGSHDSVEVRYYLSQGLKEDLHSEWERIGIDEIQKYNLELGDELHREDDRLILLNKDSIQPGNYYNIVVCIDRTVDQDNGNGDVDEIHESDNCSTEAVFYVNETGSMTDEEIMAIINLILD